MANLIKTFSDLSSGLEPGNAPALVIIDDQGAVNDDLCTQHFRQIGPVP